MYNFNLLAGYSPQFLKKSQMVPLTLARKKYPRPSLKDVSTLIVATKKKWEEKSEKKLRKSLVIIFSENYDNDDDDYNKKGSFFIFFSFPLFVTCRYITYVVVVGNDSFFFCFWFHNDYDCF